MNNYMIHPRQYSFSDIDNKYFLCPDKGTYTRAYSTYIWKKTTQTTL